MHVDLWMQCVSCAAGTPLNKHTAAKTKHQNAQKLLLLLKYNFNIKKGIVSLADRVLLVELEFSILFFFVVVVVIFFFALYILVSFYLRYNT